MKPSLEQPEASSGKATSLAKTLAPEDIAVGDYVAVLQVVYELPTFLWCGDSALERRDEPIRMQLVPDESGVPLEVTGVCLPFVMVHAPTGNRYPLDVRRHRLARLNRGYGKASFKAMQPSGAKKKRKKKRR